MKLNYTLHWKNILFFTYFHGVIEIHMGRFTKLFTSRTLIASYDWLELSLSPQIRAVFNLYVYVALNLNRWINYTLIKFAIFYFCERKKIVWKLYNIVQKKKKIIVSLSTTPQKSINNFTITLFPPVHSMRKLDFKQY